MAMSEQRKIALLPPEKLTGLKRVPIPKKAAGLKAVGSALKHLSDELGLFDGLRLMTKVNQVNGVDCPGCAWPDPEHRAKLFEYCENGAKAIAEEATTKRVNAAFFKKYSVETLSTWSDYEIGKAGRITEPFILKPGSVHYEPLTWDDAFNLIAERLKTTDPDRAVFYTSGRTGNETAFLYQLLVRKYGTNNLPDCSNMCHESSGVGLTETLGIGKGSVTLEDLYEAEVVLVIGQNPGTNHPRMLSALQRCKKNGGVIIHINPLPEVGTEKFVDPQSPLQVLTGGAKIADHFLQVRINGDIALLKLFMLGLLDAEERTPGKVLDREFILQHTTGFDAFRNALRSTDAKQAEHDCGISFNALKPIINLLAEKRKIIACWAMGITQHRNGVDNVKEIVNLLALKGSIGKPGSGVCPVRGHSNVQGDRTMGIYEKPAAEFLDQLDRVFGIQCPRKHGYDTVETITAMDQQKVDVFFAMGGNFISATPDSAFTAKAIRNCGLTVQVSTKLNRSHLNTGETAIILPCLSRTDADVKQGEYQFQTVENSMGIVHTSMGKRKPPSSLLLSETEIVCRLAMALFDNDDRINWNGFSQHYDLIRNAIEEVIPGFENFNERVRQKGGFYLPNGVKQRNFQTESGKAQFSVVRLPQVSHPEATFVMMTIRSHDQYNTTIYGLDDRYRGIKNERRIVLMNPIDMNRLKLSDGALVDLESVFNGQRRRVNQFVAIAYSIPEGNIATYFPEANALVPIDNVAEESNTPASKFVPVNVLPVRQSESVLEPK